VTIGDVPRSVGDAARLPRRERGRATRRSKRPTKAANRGAIQWEHPLVELAMIHPSYAYEGNAEGDNQRLEFLGDAVLGLTIAHILYERQPEADEGSLTRQRAALVRKETLARLARRIGIDRHLKVGRSMQREDQRGQDSALADALEALVGALYLIEGIGRVRTFVQRLWREELKAAPQAARRDEAKSLLQEEAQRRGLTVGYETVSVSGPPHERSFAVVVRVGREVLGTGQGSSKKAAETMAAQEALERLQRMDDARDDRQDGRQGS
jgi:ribonuclease-3